MAKVLLVEDDNNLREIYQARLMAEGYDIVSAMNGEEALVVAKQEQPDLVISDVMMPRISGFEMLDIMRNTTGLKDFKVIMLTALGQSEDKQRADSLGADRYLVKSQVTLEDIVNAAHELLDGAATPATEADPTLAPVTQPAPITVTAPQAVADVPDQVQEPVTQSAPVAEPVTLQPTVTPPAAVATPSEPVTSTAVPEPVQVPEPTATSPQAVTAQAPAQPVPIAEPIVPAPSDTPVATETSIPAPEPPTTQAPTTQQLSPEPTPVATSTPDALAAAQSAAAESTTIQEQINDFVAQPVAEAPVEPAEEQPAQQTTVQDETPQPITVVTAQPIEVVAAPAADAESSVVSSNDITPLDAPAIPEAAPKEDNIPTIETAQDMVMTKALQDLGGAPDNVPQVVSPSVPQQTPETTAQPEPTVVAPSTQTVPNVNTTTSQPAPAPAQVQSDDSEDDDSVTVAHKKVIRPISGQETASLGLNELMAKEGLDLSGPAQASVGGQTAPQNNPQVGVPQPPGKVVGPTSGVDPSSIAL